MPTFSNLFCSSTLYIPEPVPKLGIYPLMCFCVKNSSSLSEFRFKNCCQVWDFLYIPFIDSRLTASVV